MGIIPPKIYPKYHLLYILKIKILQRAKLYGQQKNIEIYLLGYNDVWTGESQQTFRGILPLFIGCRRKPSKRPP
jgi:hypothetical protein